MRLSMLIALWLLSTTALAYKVDFPPHHWMVESTTENGQFSRIGPYLTAGACEAANAEVLKQQRGYDGHCVEWTADEKGNVHVKDPKIRSLLKIENEVPMPDADKLFVGTLAVARPRPRGEPKNPR